MLGALDGTTDGLVDGFDEVGDALGCPGVTVGCEDGDTVGLLLGLELG